MRLEKVAIHARAMWLALGLAVLIPLKADDATKASDAQESPPTVVAVYGVNGLVLWLAADYGVTTDKDGGVTAPTRRVILFLRPTMRIRSRRMSRTASTASRCSGSMATSLFIARTILAESSTTT
jgi:hypothetical protein